MKLVDFHYKDADIESLKLRPILQGTLRINQPHALILEIMKN